MMMEVIVNGANLNALQQEGYAMPENVSEINDRIPEPISILGDNENSSRQLGQAKGKIIVPDDIDNCNDQIEDMFGINEY